MRQRVFISTSVSLSLALLLFVSGIIPAANQVSEAAPAASQDGIGDATNGDSNFDITSFGVARNNAYLNLAGEAGGSVPEEEGMIYAYVFLTNKGTYAVTSHHGNDTPGEDHEDLEWHAHKVVLDHDGCIESITPDGETQLSGDTITLKEVKVKDVFAVITAQLEAHSDEEDEHEHDGDATCVSDVFDVARAENIGVLLYTHGDMMNHHGTSETNKMMAIEELVESNGKYATEIVYHMPYNWDQGLASLESQGLEYAIFMYTDMFGPESTVIHNVTRGVFGGIEEFNHCPGVVLPPSNLCMYMGQMTIPASTVSDAILVFAEPARPDHPILRNIFLEQAQAVSENPKDEILVLVGHGARSDTNDMAQEAELSNAAAYAEKKLKFADSVGITAREDWPDLQPAALEKAVTTIQNMLDDTGAENVILVPATGSGSGFDAVAGALDAEGISYTVAPEPLPLGQDEFEKWAEKTFEETVKFIKKNKPTESTITPYWNREY
jgi:hypothetical protein